MKKDMPNMAKMNMTRNSRRQILKSAGKDMARANNKVRIPLAPLTRRRTRPTLATLTTRSSVGDTKYFSMMSLNTSPVHMSHIYITLLIFTAYSIQHYAYIPIPGL